MGDAYWRDVLALTWDFRTLSGPPKIKQFLAGRLESFKMKSFKIRDEYLGIRRPYPDIAWIQFFFWNFEAGNIACNVSSVAPSTPQAYRSWKCDVIRTPRDSAGYAWLTNWLEEACALL
ncbi:hypothetical protein ARMSODRAFT_946865 [Armillaria solidipes]|uniref:Uncharacterized protein n=1 Tax=Armillaria solidipes TaxID=1076256 RepID=A0A2H3C7Z8_9AGAR|nr:hypothetical protein ARMSODRAFT_946865 [Armillaria solidipes]